MRVYGKELFHLNRENLEKFRSMCATLQRYGVSNVRVVERKDGLWLRVDDKNSSRPSFWEYKLEKYAGPLGISDLTLEE